jgi:hypothetical protein
VGAAIVSANPRPRHPRTSLPVHDRAIVVTSRPQLILAGQARVSRKSKQRTKNYWSGRQDLNL